MKKGGGKCHKDPFFFYSGHFTNNFLPSLGLRLFYSAGNKHTKTLGQGDARDFCLTSPTFRQTIPRFLIRFSSDSLQIPVHFPSSFHILPRHTKTPSSQVLVRGVSCSFGGESIDTWGGKLDPNRPPDHLVGP